MLIEIARTAKITEAPRSLTGVSDMREWYRKYLAWSNSPRTFKSPDVSREVEFMRRIGWLKLIQVSI